MGGSVEPHGVLGAGPAAAGRLLLAGDIGGTKTILGIYSQDAGPRRPLAVRTYPSAKYPSLEAIVREFLATVHLPVDQARWSTHAHLPADTFSSTVQLVHQPLGSSVALRWRRERAPILRGRLVG